MSTSFIQLKSKNQSRLAEEKRMIDRKRNIMVLLFRHCIDAGYVETAERLQHEAGVALSKFEVADNIDLSTIVQEYEDFHEMKFGRKPKLVRRKGDDDSGTSNTNKKMTPAERRMARNSYSSSAIPPEARVENSVALKAANNSTSRTSSNSGPKISEKGNKDGDRPEDGVLDLGLVGSKPANGVKNSSKSKKQENADDDEQDVEDRLLKPPPQFANDPDLQSLATMITRDIFQKNPNVRWDDVVELCDAKRLLKEAVVMPTKYPQLFTGLLSPWCGILLFGPPGTGKTMLAKAVATECRTTFFNISASSIVSKYRGDSEKLVRMLFELARYHAPSTIFLDEIDSIMGQRGAEGGSQEHEASRRMKTELLVQMDGLAKSSDLVFVLAASNLPWELDMAMLRRLEKRVLVPLPGESARRAMILNALHPYVDEAFNIEAAVAKTEGYSGADIKLVIKEAAMGPVRRFIRTMESAENSTPLPACDDENDWSSLLDRVELSDLELALVKTKPSASMFAGKYASWQSEFGSQ